MGEKGIGGREKEREEGEGEGEEGKGGGGGGEEGEEGEEGEGEGGIKPFKGACRGSSKKSEKICVARWDYATHKSSFSELSYLAIQPE